MRFDRMKNSRTCRTCQDPFEDPGAGKRSAPAGYCSRKCADAATRERANRKASMRAVPPRAPLRLLSPSSRDWMDAHAKRDSEARCRVCGREPVDAAHIVPRSLAPNGGEQQDNIVPLCRPCHRLYDEGFLSLEEYLTAAEAACAVLLAGSLRAALRVVSGGREDAA